MQIHWVLKEEVDWWRVPLSLNKSNIAFNFTVIDTRFSLQMIEGGGRWTKVSCHYLILKLHFLLLRQALNHRLFRAIVYSSLDWSSRTGALQFNIIRGYWSGDRGNKWQVLVWGCDQAATGQSRGGGGWQRWYCDMDIINDGTIKWYCDWLIEFFSIFTTRGNHQMFRGERLCLIPTLPVTSC